MAERGRNFLLLDLSTSRKGDSQRHQMLDELDEQLELLVHESSFSDDCGKKYRYAIAIVRLRAGLKNLAPVFFNQ